MGLLFSTKCTSLNRLDDKVAVVTGANTGIGKETVKDFYKRGAKVYLACRDLEKTKVTVEDVKQSTANGTNLGELKIIQLDLCSLASVRSCAESLLKAERKIDILLNNAGVMMCPLSYTEDGFQTQFATNHLGHFLLTLLLLPIISKSSSARIVNVSSVAHNWSPGFDTTDLNWKKRRYSSLHAYEESKVANILFTKELARKLKENNITGINTYSLHPGIIRTEIARHYNSIFPGMTWVFNSVMGPVLKTPEQGAQTQIYCSVSEKCAEETGLYYAECKVAPSSEASNNTQFAKELWDISLEYVGLSKENIFKFD